MTVDWEAANIAAIGAFAENCTFTPQGGDPVVVSAVPDMPFRDADMLTGPQVSTTVPAAIVLLADMPQTPRQFDGFGMRGVAYVIREVRPDGQGLARLLLTRAA